MEQIYLAQTRRKQDLDWLQAALAPQGQVLNVGETLDEVLGLMDMTGSALVFVGLNRDNQAAQCALIEALLDVRPMLVVVALGDGLDNQLVLNAMRAGARDFIAYGARSSEVLGLVRRLVQRLPPLPPSRDQGDLTLLYGTQPDADAALLAGHLALQIQARGQRTLLIDLGVPRGESLEIFALEASFFFGDALRNIRRLDSNLLESAFTRHPEGLRLLAHGPEDDALERFSIGELFLLMGSLRQYFQHVVVNLCGQPDSDGLRSFIAQAQCVLWCVDQSVPNCRRNLALLTSWRSIGVKLDHARLLVDRYQPSVSPSLQELGRTFEMPLEGSLALSPVTRLKAKNQARSLYQSAPRDPLTQGLLNLAEQQIKHKCQPPPPWWRRALRAGS
ncbi:pilus assembly protein [Phytopseudomonas dryadis]|uniref:Pilus assembly protein n=1 Tax=Phytopseudomonas dryadis TaxID=2487520 RepID=A0A4Q9R2V6_9GAMM|nr:MULTISPECIES: pilus assembly protein [Pseudomonas]TBU92098.1 pilus assembly protein [Pseudomonas dryadis]TBV05037.1 pilus assembly protein [Pseudomonas dryadis]TBV16440.1 pilus assembly protein [Pseudomonas sp. FRB 230]